MRSLGHPKSEKHNEDKPPTVAAQFLSYYPAFINEIPSKQLKEYYTKNGHLKLIKSLKVQVISDIDTCHALWQEFSPYNTLFDTWEFRLAFYNGYKYKPHFIVLKTEQENYALLPLWYEDDEKRYVWFGSVWQEETSFLVKDPVFVPLLLSVCPSPLYLNAMTQDSLKWASEYIGFTEDDPKYILDLTTIQTVDDFLAMFKKKRRYNWRRDWKIIDNLKPEIHINKVFNLDQLIELSKRRFKEKGEETDWEDMRRIDAFRQVVSLGQKNISYSTRTITVTINNQVAAVDLVAIYKNCYYPLKCGYDVAKFPGIGNYVNLFEIKDALSLGMKKMDFLEIDYGWKSKWFESVSLYKYEKDYKVTTVG